METNTILVGFMLLIGLILLIYGLHALLSWDTSTGLGVAMAIPGLLIVSLAVYFINTIEEEKKVLLIEEVAVFLETTPEKIIIEDISESSAPFSSNENENLRKVFYDRKSYLLEVDGYEIVKLVEVKGG